jgi:chorismate mutase
MPTRAIRGATVATANSDSAILSAAHELLEAIVTANRLDSENIISVIFSLTPDLDAAYPTRAAREMGWTHVALLDVQQPGVASDLARCLRVLIHCESDLKTAEIRHVYLGEAKKLRPDLNGGEEYRKL